MTHAATKLGLSQSAVSAAISALEARHDVRLFDRVGRRVSLTEGGRIFVREARAVLNRAETAELILNDLSTKPRGQLRLHASQTVASYWLPSRLMNLHARYPEIRVDLAVGNTSSVAAAVQEGRADLGLVEGEVSFGSLRRQVVDRDRLVLVMAAGHPLAGMPDLDVALYKEFPWVLREVGSGTRSELDANLAKEGLLSNELDIVLELPSNEAVLAAVASGDSLTILSGRAVAAMVSAGWVQAPDLPHGERPFTTLTHPQRHQTQALKTFQELLREEPLGRSCSLLQSRSYASTRRSTD